MPKQRHLRLSLHVVPEISIGLCPLNPENSSSDPRRLQYLSGMVSYLNQVFRERLHRGSRAAALAAVHALAKQLPHAELLSIDDDQTPPVASHSGARDRVAFNHERLKIAFLDGLHRGQQVPVLAAGRESPEVAGLVSRLARGLGEVELSWILGAGSLDLTPAISRLRDLGLIEAVDPDEPRVAAPLRAGNGDRLSWLGHAGLLYQTPLASLCVDPFLRPHIRWTSTDLATAFSPDFADRRYFEPYGPGVRQLSPAELPPLDAVFITHQDIDHCNLGVLMMLPEDVPIVVPDWHTGRPWEVDLQALIQRVLGGNRKVLRLRHGESLSIGDVEVTAFAFHDEMPSSLETRWNCYLLETHRSAVACTADSALTDEAVEFLIRKVGKHKPLTLCSRPVHSGGHAPGYRDEDESLYNFTRLWAWYVPVWDLFQPVERPGISSNRLQSLAAGVELSSFHPYAMGTAPWFRIADREDPLHVPLANLSMKEVDAMQDVLAGLPGHTRLFPGKFAEPVTLAASLPNGKPHRLAS